MSLSFYSSISIDIKPTRLRTAERALFFVRHNGYAHHQSLMAAFFISYCQTELDEDSRHLIYSQENCARALLWDYLRRQHIGYEDHFDQFLAEPDLPKRQPDDEGQGFAIWRHENV
jgi:hypothetical protein